MCGKRNDPDREHDLAVPERRKILLAGAGLAAAPLLAGVASAAQAPKMTALGETGRFSVRAYGAARNIKADIELIRPEQINQAYERVVNKDVRYRFVIDFASA